MFCYLLGVYSRILKGLVHYCYCLFNFIINICRPVAAHSVQREVLEAVVDVVGVVSVQTQLYSPSLQNSSAYYRLID